MTVIDKKLYPELQKQFCADPEAGACEIAEHEYSANREKTGKLKNRFYISLMNLELNTV